jgi:hypothetical protein
MENLPSSPTRWARKVTPGAIVFAVLLAVFVILRSLSFWALLSVLLFGYGLIPITFGLAFIGLVCWQWSSHWARGLAVLCAPLLVLLLGVVPKPVTSPVGWAANVARVVYFQSELQRSYLDEKARGEPLPVGQLAIDGFGSLTSGLAYDPSHELGVPPNKRSDAWMLARGRAELGSSNLEVHRILGSYYFWFHD